MDMMLILQEIEPQNCISQLICMPEINSNIKIFCIYSASNLQIKQQQRMKSHLLIRTIKYESLLNIREREMARALPYSVCLFLFFSFV